MAVIYSGPDSSGRIIEVVRYNQRRFVLRCDGETVREFTSAKVALLYVQWEFE